MITRRGLVEGVVRDFYATNGHKWLMSPKGSGIVFVREEHLERWWVNTASEDWRNYDLKAFRFKAFRFSNVGTSNLSVTVGLKAVVDFYHAIGPERIYRRIRRLGRKVRDRLRERPQIRVVNASADAFHAGLVSFGAVQGDLSQVAAECDARRIRIRPDQNRIRVSTHIFTQETELNAFFDAVDRGLRGW